jgi:hypothetical protein
MKQTTIVVADPLCEPRTWRQSRATRRVGALYHLIKSARVSKCLSYCIAICISKILRIDLVRHVFNVSNSSAADEERRFP